MIREKKTHKITELSPDNNFNTQQNSQDIISSDSNIPISPFLKNSIIATLNNDNLNIKVDSKYDMFDNMSSGETFYWGIHITSSLNNKKVGDKFLEISICMDENYNLISSGVYVFSVMENGYLYIDHLDMPVSFNYDGKYFNIDCNISNQYMDLNNICVQATAYNV